MTRTANLISLTAALCIALAAPAAHARYDEHDAQRDCERKISHDSRYKGLRSVEVDDKGHNSYRVTGKVRMDGSDADFNCRIRHKEVVSWHIDGEYGHHGDNDNNDGNTAAAVGAGVLAVAAIAALASSDDDDHHNNSRNDYHNDRGDAFSDMSYLKKECRHELKRHLSDDHGKVEQLKLKHVHLDGRKLRGDGRVQFRHGGDRHLSFACKFDRRGRIHDGDYHYY